MSNLVFALNATIPLFVMIALGFFLKKMNIINDAFLKSANKFNFRATLPVLLFTDLATTDVRSTFDLKFFLFCAISTTVFFWGIWGISRVLLKGKDYLGEFVQASYRSSVAVMGIALIQNIYGTATMGGMMLLGCVPLYNIYAVILLEATSQGRSGKVNGKKLLLGVVKNPLVIGILLGLLSSLIGVTYPAIIQTSLSYISRIATPFALICIGGEFNFKMAMERIKPTIIAVVIKIVILPIVFVTFAVLMGFRDESLIAIFVLVASPTTPSAFIMAKEYGHEGSLTASVVVITMLLSILSMTLYVFVLRSMGLI